jgi:Ser/Thr protein kinase RdoA (MazF antagonist)
MWNKDLVNAACRRFQGTEGSVRPVGAEYHNIFEYERDGETCILKLFPLAVKDREQLYAELQWIGTLRSHGLPVPKQVLSARGQSVESLIRLPIPCSAISFKKAFGIPVDTQNSMTWNSRLFRRWGVIMGKMHAISARHYGAENRHGFEDWNEGEIYHRDLSFAEGPILDRWNAMQQRLHSLPRTPASYGVIHNAFHPGNFFLTPTGDLILFSFNRIKYHWFTYDIAVSLYHAMENVPDEWRESFREQFLVSFMEGYRTEQEPVPDWRDQVDFFLQYRLIFDYLSRLTKLCQNGNTEEDLKRLDRLRRRILDE